MGIPSDNKNQVEPHPRGAGRACRRFESFVCELMVGRLIVVERPFAFGCGTATMDSSPIRTSYSAIT